MDKVGIGIIGTGGIANAHAEAVLSLEEAELVAACDIVPEKARAFAERYHIADVYTDARAFFKNPRLQAALVCTPHRAHCPLAMQAAQAGIHVMVEKPLTVDLREADQAIEAAVVAGIKFGVIFQRRFWPAAQRAHKAIADGKLGEVILGDCIVKWWREKSYYDLDSWRGTWAGEGGAVLVNQSVHAIDMYQWLMGPVDTVYGLWANLSHPYIEAEDAAVAALRFKNGALGIIEVTVCTKPQLGSRIQIHGKNGAGIGILEHPEGRAGVNDLWTIPGEEEENVRILAEQNAAADKPRAERGLSFHALQIQDFVHAIQEGREPAVTAEEGRKAVEIIQAIYQSNRTGKPVQLPL
jgi:UDP-N-acetyl-2-amino-2-deoxyglucuronate dehydrogenase